MSSYVNTETSSGITTITFYTPDHNALPSPILERLKKAILTAGASEETQVIVLKSDGDRTFCAGADFKELLSISDENQGDQFFMGFAKVILAMRSCGKIIIGGLQGKAVGGGVGLAASMDYCFATNYASIKLSEISIGIGPFVIAPAVERKIGLAAFSEMTLNATSFYDPQWAKRKGLFAEIYEDRETMDEAINGLAQKVASYNPEALSACKKIFWEKTENWPELLEKRAKMSGTLVLSDFTRNALHKYK